MNTENTGVLKPPAGEDAKWQQKAQRAIEIRKQAQETRKGKPVVLQTRRLSQQH